MMSACSRELACSSCTLYCRSTSEESCVPSQYGGLRVRLHRQSAGEERDRFLKKKRRQQTNEKKNTQENTRTHAREATGPTGNERTAAATGGRAARRRELWPCVCVYRGDEKHRIERTGNWLTLHAVFRRDETGRLEPRALVRTVAERLVLRPAARAPVVWTTRAGRWSRGGKGG